MTRTFDTIAMRRTRGAGLLAGIAVLWLVGCSSSSKSNGSGGAGGLGGSSAGGSAGHDASIGNGGAGGGTGGTTGGTSGTSLACGGPGQPCCTGNACNANGCCIPMTTDAAFGGTTRLCVAAGQECTGTGVSGTCSAGSCGNCGAVGQPCCGGTDGGGFGAGAGTCTASGSRCTNGSCAACGGEGGACCQGNQCQGSLVCAAAAGGAATCSHMRRLGPDLLRRQYLQHGPRL
jgi:hypothetical protein